MNIHVNLICNIPKLGWEGAQGIFWVNGNFLYLDWGSGYTVVYIYQIH